MKRILMYGATGRTGKLALEYAIEQGYEVTALVRNPDKLSLHSEKLSVIKGLPTNIEDVRNAMKNCDYVVSLLSALPEKESMSFKRIAPPHTIEKSIRNTIECMRESDIKRIISLSSIGVGDSRKYAPWFMRLFIKISNFKIVFADHDKEEQLLVNSNLDWTIARPVGLNNNEILGQLVISYDKTPSPFKMSRKQLAKFMIDNLDNKEFIHKMPILSEKK
ncbi:putative NADH-flavin reductase [Pedobacter sp. UYP30]|uniref:NAD(P)-dependent oxidoreductase n=1 Tax=Pedobacter sp. UYP30 TaxID=1756400 RepID=UPI003396F6C8